MDASQSSRKGGDTGGAYPEGATPFEQDQPHEISVKASHAERERLRAEAAWRRQYSTGSSYVSRSSNVWVNPGSEPSRICSGILDKYAAKQAEDDKQYRRSSYHQSSSNLDHIVASTTRKFESTNLNPATACFTSNTAGHVDRPPDYSQRYAQFEHAYYNGYFSNHGNQSTFSDVTHNSDFYAPNGSNHFAPHPDTAFMLGHSQYNPHPVYVPPVQPPPAIIVPPPPPIAPSNKLLRTSQHQGPLTLNTQAAAKPIITQLPRRPKPGSIALPVPTPTKHYMQYSNFTKTEPSGQPMLLILDLNGTLLHRPKSDSINPQRRARLSEFLTYAFAYFTVMVWTTARPDNAERMVNAIFTEEQRNKLVAVWNRDFFELTEAQYNTKLDVYKRLEWVWAANYVQRSHPQRGKGKNALDGRWSQKNTILIDDSLYKASAQPFNHILVPEFTGAKSDLRFESKPVLAQVGIYLEEARFQGNVSGWMKKKPFKVEE